MNRKGELQPAAIQRIPICRIVVLTAGICLGIATCGLLFAADQATKPAVPALVLLDGRMVPVSGLTIQEEGLTGTGVPAGLLLADVWRIDLATAVPPVPHSGPVIELVGGGKLLGESVAIFDDRCALDWKLSPRLSLPIDAVRAIRLTAAASASEFDKAFAAPVADQDRIFMEEKGEMVSVAGLVESLQEKELAFEYEGARKTIPRGKLVGIVLAQARADAALPPATISLANGSTLGGSLLALTAEQLTVRLPGETDIPLPVSAVVSISLRSPRLQFLAEMQPVEVEERALVTLTRPWQKNRSTLGRPLTLGSRVFEQGIGVHARSRLTFAADGQFDVLAGVIGIDAETGGRGDCVFSVLGDGQPLFSQRMKGSDPAKELQVDIRGRRQVTLLVEPGEDLDLGDHADWCEIQFIKNAK